MSYILEALKKSEQERQKGQVPDISSLHGANEPVPGRRRPSGWIIGGIIVILAGAGFFLLTIDRTPIEIPAPTRLQTPEAVFQAQSPARATVPLRMPRADTPAMARVEKITPAREASAQPPPYNSDKAQEQVPKLADLPAAERDRIPGLAIAAHFYSVNPASRMVSINGRLLHQGDEVKPGLIVDKITREGVIFSSGAIKFFHPVY